MTQLRLADSSDVAHWCREATRHLADNRLPDAYHAAVDLFQRKPPTQRLYGSELIGAILVSTRPYYGLHNYFSIVIGETKSGVVAAMLGSAKRGGSVGDEIPIIPNDLSETAGRDIFRPDDKRPFWAWKRDGRFWGNDHLWTLWNGKPMPYDLND